MYQKILVPVDGSPTSNCGLQEAIRLAKLTGAQIRLLHVIDVMAPWQAAEAYAASADLLQWARKAGEEVLVAARALVHEQGIPVDTVSYDSTQGRVAELVADEAVRWKADIIVLGTHGRRGVGRVLIGSDAEQVVRSAPVPVLLVRDKTPQ
jgi:nucleotide-binding universal stress UspA family protein